MRLIGIEEHFQAAAAKAAMAASDFDILGALSPEVRHKDALEDLGDGRLADMDASGIDFVVLSQTAGIRSDVDIAVAAGVNDELAAAVALHPDRFAGFATLALDDPQASAKELDRAVTSLGLKGVLVNGTHRGRFLDDPFYSPILEAAEALGVPIYIHPGEPPDTVYDAYYKGGLKPSAGVLLATSGWGWHVEVGLHSLRLILAGVFDQFPKLQFIIGHMGEAVPFFLTRASEHLDPFAGLSRPVSEYFVNHFYVTTSGMFTVPPLLCLLLVLGADRIIFSVDYPYASNAAARTFFDTAPISPADREKIAHGNVERLLGL
jgi:predicted TIM-barrel fold metal-dependent hydrolase